MNKIIGIVLSVLSIDAIAQNSINKSTVINDVLLGTSSNAYTVAGIRTALDCNPQINTITFIHRADPSVGIGNNSGELFFDVSNDGGVTWSINQGPLFLNSSGTNNARFPNAVIFNPVGNTNPANAYLTYYTPVEQNNGLFSADAFGTGKLGAPFSTTQNVTSHPYPDGTDLTVPDGMIITQQGETYVCDARLTSGSFGSYDGTLQLRHGVWNGSNDMNYNTEFLSIPVDHDSNGNANYAGKCGVAFANDGLTGYAWINGHYNFNIASDSVYNLGIAKTTDGGLTWGDVTYVTFNGTGSGTVDNLLGGLGSGIFSTWTESDGIVDKNGNLHIVCAIAPLAGSFSINSAPGTWGLFDIYTIDGGLTWKAELLEKPKTFEAIYIGATGPPLFEYSRPQVAKTWTGDKLFFGWMDTDTLAFGTLDNLNPDIHLRAFNANNGTWTSPMNMTSSIPSLNGACTFFNLAPYVTETAGTYHLPCTYTRILSDIGNPVEHHYLNGVQVMNIDFTVNGNAANLNSFLVGIDENDGNIVSNVNLYPNPANDQTTILIDLKKGTNVSIELRNMLGEIILKENNKEMLEGKNQINMDTRQIQNGIYMVVISTNESKISKKLAIFR